MRTIPRRWPRYPKGDYKSYCDICGVKWPRSKLVRSTDGLYMCPHDYEQTPAELDRANAAIAARRQNQWAPVDHTVGGSDLFTVANGVAPGEFFDDTCFLTTEGGDILETEGGDSLLCN